MAQTRFFQHLNETDENFQKVTTLEFIDNSEGFTMYYFADGTQCNKQYIAPINADSIQGFEFAEVTSPRNIWKLNLVIPTVEEPKVARTQSGELVEAPSWEDYTGNTAPCQMRVDVLGKPAKVENYKEPNDSDYFFNPDSAKVNETKSFDFNENITTEPLKKTQPKNEVNAKLSEINNEHIKVNNNELHLNVDDLMTKFAKVIVHIGDQTTELALDEFFENALTPKEEKVVEKVVEKEVVIKTSDTDIELGVTPEQQSLINNMIDMSNKTEYSIGIEFTLNLPPTSIYKLVKTAYPEEMSKGFINIIANRMQVKELKTAVADGLLTFYNDDFNNSEFVADDDLKTSNKKNIAKKVTK